MYRWDSSRLSRDSCPPAYAGCASPCAMHDACCCPSSVATCATMPPLMRAHISTSGGRSGRACACAPGTCATCMPGASSVRASSLQVAEWRRTSMTSSPLAAASPSMPRRPSTSRTTPWPSASSCRCGCSSRPRSAPRFVRAAGQCGAATPLTLSCSCCQSQTRERPRPPPRSDSQHPVCCWLPAGATRVACPPRLTGPAPALVHLHLHGTPLDLVFDGAGSRL